MRTKNFCVFATTACSGRTTSTSRPTSRSSSRPSCTTSTSGSCTGPRMRPVPGMNSDALAKAIGREPPIDQLVEHGSYVVRTAVLIVQVVGVFPHVNGQQWFHVLDQRRLGITGLDHLQPVGVLHEPNPAAAELCRRRGHQCFLAGIQVSE